MLFNNSLLLYSQVGISKNSNFFVRARKYRPENRSLRGVNEDSRTELTPLSRKKCIFRGAQVIGLQADVVHFGTAALMPASYIA